MLTTINQSEKVASFFNVDASMCKFTPQSKVATYPAYRVGTNSAGAWKYVTKLIPNIGVKVSIDVPFEMANTQASVSFKTTDRYGGYCAYKTL